MLRPVQRADELDVVLLGRCIPDPVEDALVESDAEVLGGASELSETLDVVRKPREQEIEGAQLDRRGRLAGDLPGHE